MRPVPTSTIAGFSAVLVISLLLTSSCFDGNPVFGPPLEGSEVAPGEWTWYDVEGMVCRDGSATGIGMQVQDPKRLVIWLRGGGACFSPQTCNGNPASYNEDDFMTSVSGTGSGILDLTRLENPVRDWSFIYIPYCTGDVHLGRRYQGQALGVEGNQAFVGSFNFRKAMTFIRPYFEENGIEEILLFGTSAGGFGAFSSFVELKRHFPDVRVTMINDSGPLLNDENAFSFCLQVAFIAAYGVEIPPGYLTLGSIEDGLAHSYEYCSQFYPSDNFGFVTNLQDNTNRFFLSFGYDNCAGAPGNAIPADEFRQALIDLRDDELVHLLNWSTFYVDDDAHTLLNDNNLFYDTEIEGLKLYEWLAQLLSGETDIHVTNE